MDVRRSRRDRLTSIPPDHLLLMARKSLFGGSYNFSKSTSHATKVLESVAARGSEESGWLLDKLRSKIRWSSSCWWACGRVVGRVVVVVKGRRVALVSSRRTRRWSRRGGGEGTACGAGVEPADASLVASWWWGRYGALRWCRAGGRVVGRVVVVVKGRRVALVLSLRTRRWSRRGGG